MADANTVIANLGQQVAQLTVDKAIIEAELAEPRENSPPPRPSPTPTQAWSSSPMVEEP